jgi:Fe-S cluster assembly ATP-binding protein
MSHHDKPVFSVRDVHVFVDDKPIVKGVDLDILAGETHAVMGPNGSGKSTFAAALMGHPAYRVEGHIELDGRDISELPPHERARAGMFLGFQYPVAVPGVPVANFLRAAMQAHRGEDIKASVFCRELFGAFDDIGVPHEFAVRYLNDGFSGGEKKRMEILQMLMLRPRFALLDEIDSGLDIDALRVVADGINRLRAANGAVLLVTHYQRILDHVKPDVVHVFKDGRIVRTGGPEVALELEQFGYAEHDAGTAALGGR